MFLRLPVLRSLSIGLNRQVPSRCISTTLCRPALEFTQQHDELRTTLRKIVENDINPYVEQWEKEGMFDAHKVFKVLGNAGLLGITRDPAYGGLGLDYSYVISFFEELSSTINAGGPATGIAVQTEMSQPALARFGTDELKKLFLAPTISGDYVSCVGVSESSGGSDVAAIRTTAKRDGDDYIINGGKMWTTNGVQADWMCLLAQTDPGGKPHLNKTLFCMPMKTKGITISRSIKKLGLWSSDTAESFFEDVRIPAKYMIGEENMGFVYQMMQFQDERMSCIPMTTGGLKRLIRETIKYCRDRHTFGSPLIDNQYIHFRLAELMSEVELLESLGYRAAEMMIKGEDVTYLASIGKLKAGRLSREVSDTCLQFFGGMGYAEETGVARHFRDGRALSIAGGGDEIMLGIIAKFMDILPGKKKTSKKEDKVSS